VKPVSIYVDMKNAKVDTEIVVKAIEDNFDLSQ